VLRKTQFDEVIRFNVAADILGRGRYWTTCYLVDGMLIDTGCAHTAHELQRAVGECLHGAPLRCILNTHTHEDHIGADGPFQYAQPGLEILAHPLALEVIAHPREKQLLHPYRRLFWGWPQAAQARPLADGETLMSSSGSFRVIYTPGHSPDHLCLYEEQRGWLFTGDLFVGGRDRALRQGCNIWQIIASLKHIATLDITTLFPGSARTREHPQEELQAKIAYYEELGGQILEQYRQGLGTPEIVRALCGGPMWVEIVTLGHFSRRWLVLSYLQNAPENNG
jgi:glyoxylase-like metal-dependent hydrolase (beta-lactamase superfamily II)